MLSWGTALDGRQGVVFTLHTNDMAKGFDGGPVRMVELPTLIGVLLSNSLELRLEKGAGHKYMRKVWTGSRWRYFYSVSGGAGLGHHDEFHEGAKFKLAHGGKAGHFEVTGKTDDGKLKIKHDESGHEEHLHPDALKEMLHREHADALDGHTKKIAQDLKDVAKHGSDKQKARLQAEAGKYGHTEHLTDAGKAKAKAGAGAGGEAEGGGKGDKDKEAAARKKEQVAAVWGDKSGRDAADREAKAAAKTRSGKGIPAHTNEHGDHDKDKVGEATKDWSASDHDDAAAHHDKAARESDEKSGLEGEDYDKHQKDYNAHLDAAGQHEDAAEAKHADALEADDASKGKVREVAKVMNEGAARIQGIAAKGFDREREVGDHAVYRSKDGAISFTAKKDASPSDVAHAFVDEMVRRQLETTAGDHKMTDGEQKTARAVLRRTLDVSKIVGALGPIGHAKPEAKPKSPLAAKAAAEDAHATKESARHEAKAKEHQTAADDLDRGVESRGIHQVAATQHRGAAAAHERLSDSADSRSRIADGHSEQAGAHDAKADEKKERETGPGRGKKGTFGDEKKPGKGMSADEFADNVSDIGTSSAERAAKAKGRAAGKADAKVAVAAAKQKSGDESTAAVATDKTEFGQGKREDNATREAASNHHGQEGNKHLKAAKAADAAGDHDLRDAHVAAGKAHVLARKSGGYHRAMADAATKAISDAQARALKPDADEKKERETGPGKGKKGTFGDDDAGQNPAHAKWEAQYRKYKEGSGSYPKSRGRAGVDKAAMDAITAKVDAEHDETRRQESTGKAEGHNAEVERHEKAASFHRDAAKKELGFNAATAHKDAEGAHDTAAHHHRGASESWKAHAMGQPGRGAPARSTTAATESARADKASERSRRLAKPEPEPKAAAPAAKPEAAPGEMPTSVGDMKAEHIAQLRGTGDWTKGGVNRTNKDGSNSDTQGEVGHGMNVFKEQGAFLIGHEASGLVIGKNFRSAAEAKTAAMMLHHAAGEGGIHDDARRAAEQLGPHAAALGAHQKDGTLEEGMRQAREAKKTANSNAAAKKGLDKIASLGSHQPEKVTHSTSDEAHAKAKGSKRASSFAASPSEYRPGMSQYLVKDGRAVSTDGKRAASIPVAGHDDGHYASHNPSALYDRHGGAKQGERSDITKDGDKSFFHDPLTSAVHDFVDPATYPHKASLDASQLRTALDGSKFLAKGAEHRVSLESKDGAMTMHVTGNADHPTHAGQKVSVPLGEHEGPDFAMDVQHKFLSDAMKGAKGTVQLGLKAGRKGGRKSTTDTKQGKGKQPDTGILHVARSDGENHAIASFRD